MFTDMAADTVAFRTSNPGAAEGSARRRSLSAEVLLGGQAHDALRAEWERLAASQSAPVLFQTPQLVAAWAKVFIRNGSAALATVIVRGQDGQALLVWPVCVEKRALLRVVKGAGNPVGQYDEILVDPDCLPAEVWAEALAAVRRELRPDLVLLERVRADGPLSAALGDAAPLGTGEAAPYADLSAGVAKLMGELKTRVVRQQKKRVKRFEQEGVVAFTVAESPEQAEALLAEAMALKRDWLRATGRFSRAFLKAETAECLLECARALSPADASPRMVVSQLSLDGRTAAIEMGFCHRGTYHLYLGAFDPELAKFGPGNILTEKVLGWCAANGITRYDMLAPRSRNKSEWQSGEVAVADYALATSLRGRVYVEGVLRRLMPATRRGFYALPDRFRSALAGVALRNLGRRGGAGH